MKKTSIITKISSSLTPSTKAQCWEVINALTYNAKVNFVCKKCKKSYAFSIGITHPKGREINCCVFCLSDNVEIKSVRKLSNSCWKRLEKEWEACPTTDKDGNRIC